MFITDMQLSVGILSNFRGPEDNLIERSVFTLGLGLNLRFTNRAFCRAYRRHNLAGRLIELTSYHHGLSSVLA